MNPLTKFCNWYLKKKLIKQKKAQAKKVDKDKQIVYEQLRQLYSFVKWLNTKGLPNRHARKSFWRAVYNGQPVIENTINQIIENHKKKDKK